MTRLRMALWRLHAMFRRSALDHQLNDEIQSHIDMLTEENVRDGMSPEDARRAAVRAFGGVERVKEMHRDGRAFPWLEQIGNDIWHSIRSLLKNPAFTLFAALTLAVGVGVNTTVFDIYNAIALKPIAVADPDHVVRFKRWFESHRLGPDQHMFSYCEYTYVRDHSDDLFSDVIAASRPVAPNATLPPNAVRVSVVGKHLQLDMDWHGSMADFEVVGIVKDVRLASLSRIDPTHVYLTLKGKRTAPYAVLLKSRDGTRVLPAIQAAVAFENKDLAGSLMMQNIEFFTTSELVISEDFAWIAAILAALSLVLAGTGIYGVMSYLVTRRTKEIGVRMSLGATSRDVLQDVIVRGMRPIFLGMLAGIVLAGIASLIFRWTLQFPGSLDFLYGVPFYDPVSFIGLSVFVLFIAALGSLIPAIRALRVDPMVALRHE